MGEYDRTGNGQSSKTDWDLRSILCDIAKNWWVILLIACSAAMITYTVMATVHKDRYTVKTTFAVMGRGVSSCTLGPISVLRPIRIGARSRKTQSKLTKEPSPIWML